MNEQRRPPNRFHSLAHLVAPARVRESLALAPSPAWRSGLLAGAQVAVATLLAFAFTHATPWADAAGFACLGALAALFGRFDAPGQRPRTLVLSALLLVAPIALVSAATLSAAPMGLLLLLLGLVAGVLVLLAQVWRLGPPGATIFFFAASAALAPAQDWATVGQRSALAALGALIALLVCSLSERWRPRRAGPPPAPAGRGMLRSAVRLGAVTACAGLLAHALGLPYPAWAAIGALAVLQGAGLHIVMQRALQRMAGTVLGVGLAALVFAAEPGLWHLLLAVLVLQVVTEVVIGLNYSLGQITVTPMALLMSSLSAPAGAAAMPSARLLDTVVGVAVGVGLSLLLSSLEERRALAEHHARSRASA